MSTVSCLIFSLAAACSAEGDRAGAPVISALVGEDGFWQGGYFPLNDVVLVERDDVRVIANGNLALSFIDSHFEGTLDADHELDTPVTVASSTLQATPPVAFTVNAAAAAGTLLTN